MNLRSPKVIAPLLAVGLAAALLARADTPVEPVPLRLDAAWVETTPDQVGLDPARLEAAAARAAAQPRVRALLAARHGRLAFERYAAGQGPESLFDVRSVTKSVVSLLTGIALGEGRLPSLDVSIATSLRPMWRVDDEDATVTLRHLVTMTSGYAWDESTAAGYNQWVLSPDPVQYLLDRPRSGPAGTRWAYNSAGVHVLGVAMERMLGTPLAEYAREKLFAPLGIVDAAWEPMAGGYVNGSSGLDLRARDLLKLGQLVLQRGRSGDVSVVPEAWIGESTRAAHAWRRPQGPLPSVGYGALWWVADADPAAVFAQGYGGQFVYVAPELDLVVVTTTEWRSLTEISPDQIAFEMLGVISDIVAAARMEPP
ncbi:MAG: beta-lactamase family protein [Vicinamibacteria bacterium]|nr:beta-lactamase family protein [Vicinamibacteria bacterium]